MMKYFLTVFLSLFMVVLPGLPKEEAPAPVFMEAPLERDVRQAESLAGMAYTELDSRYFDFCVKHGQPFSWQPETWVAFREELKPMADRLAMHYPHVRMSLVYELLNMDYALPGEGEMSFSEAKEKAWQALEDRLIAEGHDMAQAAGFFISLGVEDSFWKIHFFDGKKVEGTPYVMLDARSGEVVDLGRWPAAINLISAFGTSSIQEANHQQLRPGPSPRADGKRAFWYGDFAPAHYWEQLDKSPWLDKGMAEWQAAFGSNQNYWPLEVKALEFLLRQPEYNPHWNAMTGLPGPEDIPQDKAMELALAELTKTEKVAEDVKSRLKPNVDFLYYPQDSQGHVTQWFIQFHDPEHPVHELLFSVMMDGRTGEILLVQGPEDGNG